MTPSMSSMLPGAAESDCVATSVARGTRWSAALTVVSTTAGRSRPLSAREPRQRGHALRDDAGMRRDAVVGQAVPGRESSTARSGAKNASARASAAMRWPSRQTTTRLVAGAFGARRDRAREIGDDQALGAVGDAGERQRRGRASSSSAGDCAIRPLRAPCVEVAQPAEQRGVEVRRRPAARR